MIDLANLHRPRDFGDWGLAKTQSFAATSRWRTRSSRKKMRCRFVGSAVKGIILFWRLAILRIRKRISCCSRRVRDSQGAWASHGLAESSVSSYIFTDPNPTPQPGASTFLASRARLWVRPSRPYSRYSRPLAFRCGCGRSPCRSLPARIAWVTAGCQT